VARETLTREDGTRTRLQFDHRFSATLTTEAGGASNSYYVNLDSSKV
jgi:hypothetical protein